MHGRKISAMELLVFALLVAALVYGLQRNHARQGAPHSMLAGSNDAQDRDHERVLHDLRTR